MCVCVCVCVCEKEREGGRGLFDESQKHTALICLFTEASISCLHYFDLLVQ